jgi:hypothetical protein
MIPRFQVAPACFSFNPPDLNLSILCPFVLEAPKLLLENIQISIINQKIKIPQLLSATVHRTAQINKYVNEYPG